MINLYSIHDNGKAAIRAAAGYLKAGNENDARDALNGAHQHFSQNEGQVVLEIIDATRTVAAADSERNNPKRQVVQAKLPEKVQVQWDIFDACARPGADKGIQLNRAKAKALTNLVNRSFLENRLPSDPKNSAFSFLEVQDLSALACCSPTLHYQLTHQMPRVWQAVARTFTVIQWPDFSNVPPRAIKLTLIDTFAKIKWANWTLNAYTTPNHPLKRDIAKYSKKSAKDLVCKIDDHRLRFENHTFPIVKAIETNSPNPGEHFRILASILGSKCSDDPRGFLNMFFTCGAATDGSTLGSFIQSFRNVIADSQGGDFLPAWIAAFDLIVKEGPLPNVKSLIALFGFYQFWYNDNPEVRFDKGVITQALIQLLRRGVKIDQECLNYYALNSLPRAPLNILEPLCRLAAKDGIYLTRVAQFLLNLFYNYTTKMFRRERGEDILKVIALFRSSEGYQAFRNDEYDSNFSSGVFYNAAKFQHAPLMQKVIGFGARPNNSESPENTLSRALTDKVPLGEISVLCGAGAKPCQGTFDLIAQYSQNLEAQSILTSFLMAQLA